MIISFVLRATGGSAVYAANSLKPRLRLLEKIRTPYLIAARLVTHEDVLDFRLDYFWVENDLGTNQVTLMAGAESTQLLQTPQEAAANARTWRTTYPDPGVPLMMSDKARCTDWIDSGIVRLTLDRVITDFPMFIQLAIVHHEDLES